MVQSNSTGQFQVVKGNVVGPDGNPFFAKGINVFESQMGSAEQILARLPGINFVRLAIYSYQSPEAYSSFIKTMSDHGVVVELENHNNGTADNNGGARGSAFTGSQLTAESDWYASVAHAYASNPYVWFGTNNEPPQPGLAAWQEATYNAIRGAGNNNPVMIELPGGGVPGLDSVGYGLEASVYGKMSNIIADIHYYGWESNFSTDQNVVDAVLARLVQDTQTVQSHDGMLPVIIGEYGPSTYGVSDDANNAEVVQAVQKSVQIAGAIAFAWNAGANDNVTDQQGNLTVFGQRVAQWVAASGASADGAASFLISDQSSGVVMPADGEVYTGSVPGIMRDIILATTHNINIVSKSANVFIHTGSGNDAIDVSAANGNNILDGGTGSNFLTGGTGNDTFYLDNRNPLADVFSTIVNFHSGDNASVFGVNATDFTLTTLDGQGAVGATGLDFAFAAPGHANANVVLAGFSKADLANGRLTVTYGTTPDTPGLPGSQYMNVHAN